MYTSEPIGVYRANQVHWLDETTVVISSIPDRRQVPNADSQIIPPSTRRINLETGEVTIFPLSGTFASNVAPNGVYWINGHNIIDLRTFETISIIRDDVPQGYGIFSKWLENGELEVRVSAIADSNQVSVYRVVLP